MIDERVALHHKTCADHRWIAPVGVLPHTVAQHGDRWRIGLVVIGSKHSSAKRAHPER